MVKDIIQLLDDPLFKLWISSPNESIVEYWHKILRENPDRKESVDKARSILVSLNREFANDLPDDKTINKMLSKILSKNEHF